MALRTSEGRHQAFFAEQERHREVFNRGDRFEGRPRGDVFGVGVGYPGYAYGYEYPRYAYGYDDWGYPGNGYGHAYGGCLCPSAGYSYAAGPVGVSIVGVGPPWGW